MIGDLDQPDLAGLTDAADSEPMSLELTRVVGIHAVVAVIRLDAVRHAVEFGGQCAWQDRDRLLLADQRTDERRDDETGSLGARLRVFGVPVPENVARELDDRVLEPASRAHERDATLARDADGSQGAIHVAVWARRRNQETAVRGELGYGIVADRLGWHPLEPETGVVERVVREQMRRVLRIEIADDRYHGPHLRGVMVAYGAVSISRHEEDAMLAIWVKVRVKPDQRQRFLKAIEVDALGSERDEAGCLRFNVLQDAQDQNVYYFYEVYKDEKALEAHRAAPHYAVWRAAADTLDGPTEPTRCQPVFPADRAYWGKM